eukprot:CAMPEP_0171797526 /NCGR_PEP_ID=MMETSP0991-20121206/69995_1 /TAXON_ID=483369 /ORGANISM="non described non described, Strain CCMP2098" /LENGTH=55 /DNA_ID=CAMNT_0012408579 /DNA_START=20 /DNA_END=183 /DNA_ORIENTATION=-
MDKSANLKRAMSYSVNHNMDTAKRIPDCLFTLEPEKLETLLKTVKTSLDEVKASG